MSWSSRQQQLQEAHFSRLADPTISTNPASSTTSNSHVLSRMLDVDKDDKCVSIPTHFHFEELLSALADQTRVVLHLPLL